MAVREPDHHFVRLVTDEQFQHTAGVFRMQPFIFESGAALPHVDLAFETWGRLNARGDNAIVVCHALTGDAHAGPGKSGPGWWSRLIGPGCALDSEQWFVICSNVLGGCAGSTGPSSLAPDGKPYALRFPLVTVRDIVRAQVELVRALGVNRVAMVIGGSLGGMQVWEWPLLAPGFVEHAVAIAAHAVFPAIAIGYNEAMRQAIVADENWRKGEYYDHGLGPVAGLAAARSIGMLTYRSEALYTARFGRGPARPSEGEEAAVWPPSGGASWPNAHEAFTRPLFAVESYLHHHGRKLNARFDANSYLYLTRAMDSHDIGRGRGGLEPALKSFGARLTLMSISTDYLYAPSTLRETAEMARQCGVDCRYFEMESDYGHDAFLLEQDKIAALLAQPAAFG
ncbi:MAG: homoserine O-acetyltransferase [Alicyclobacillaceae bacterium]|nr:homoserine O-acetyltransferase [Alicyclobacillaceae bacterium]